MAQLESIRLVQDEKRKSALWMRLVERFAGNMVMKQHRFVYSSSAAGQLVTARYAWQSGVLEVSAPRGGVGKKVNGGASVRPSEMDRQAWQSSLSSLGNSSDTLAAPLHS